MRHPQLSLNLAAKLVVVLFAGAGGSCTGIEKAIGRHVDIAANHNDDAMSCHRANHPQTRHFIEDVRVLDPRELCGTQPVGYFHVSPDCTHFSQAKGGQPRNKAIRSLPWVTIKWAGTVRPEVISLENVKQIRDWSRLIAKRDKATGRVVKIDGTVAAPGEHVPVGQQFLVPDPKRKGHTWRRFLAILRKLGYEVDHRVLCAADYDVPQRRNRLFMLARCDGGQIVWPEPVRVEKPKNRKQKAWRGAHESIDFSLPSKSIFGRKKPLAPATLRRVARGVDKFVLKSADPFIVPVTHTKGGDRVNDIRQPLPVITTAKGGELMLATPVMLPATHQGDARVHDLRAPAPTVTGANRGELMLATAELSPAAMAPVMIQAGHGDGRPGGTQRWGLGATSVRQPSGVVTASGGGQAVATAYLAQMNGGWYTGAGEDLRRPISTLTACERGAQQMLVATTLAHLRNNCDARDIQAPLNVISAGGEHHVLVETPMVPAEPEAGAAEDAAQPEIHLAPEHKVSALRCAAFLMEYYSEGGQWSDLRKPANTITTKDRLALVTVWIKGSPYVIVDICLRMLTPRELANATSFPPQYVITHGHDGRMFTKSKQVKMIGNAVPPEMQYHVTAANYRDTPAEVRMAA